MGKQRRFVGTILCEHLGNRSLPREGSDGSTVLRACHQDPRSCAFLRRARVSSRRVLALVTARRLDVYRSDWFRGIGPSLNDLESTSKSVLASNEKFSSSTNITNLLFSLDERPGARVLYHNCVL